MNTETPNDIAAEEAVMATLESRGWKVNPYWLSATKMFDTAVGPKQAVFALSPGDEYNRTLFGSYLTEGNDILAAGLLLPHTATPEQAAVIAARWADNAEKKIGDSYAVRLLRHH